MAVFSVSVYGKINFVLIFVGVSKFKVRLLKIVLLRILFVFNFKKVSS